MVNSLRSCLAGSILVITGCFPVELDVNGKGEILAPRQEGFFVYNSATRTANLLDTPRGGRPVFARFMPDGRKALLVTKLPGEQYRFDLAGNDNNTPKTIYTGRNTAYALFSPDGKYLAVSRVTENERKTPAKGRIPEILIIDLLTEKATTLVEDAHLAFRWFRDSRRIVCFKIESGDKDGNSTGQLVEIDIASKKQKRLAAVVAGQKMCIELAPDQQAVVFSASSAGKPGIALESPMARNRLWRWSAKDGSVSEFHDSAEFARYSPSGGKVLLARMNALGAGELRIADAEGKAEKPLPANAALSVGADLTLPGWLDDDTVFYFATRNTYGGGAPSLCLNTIRTDGKAATNLQPALDYAVYQIAKDLPEVEPDRVAGLLDGPDLEPGKVVVEPAQTEPSWLATLLSRQGLLVFGTTAVLVVIPAYIIIRRLSRRRNRADE